MYSVESDLLHSTSCLRCSHALVCISRTFFFLVVQLSLHKHTTFIYLCYVDRHLDTFRFELLKTAKNILEQIFGGQMHSFLLASYSGEGLPGHKAYKCLASVRRMKL